MSPFLCITWTTSILSVPLGSSICQHNLDRSVDCFSKLGIILHPVKLEGLSTCLTDLGIKLDSLNLQPHLPKDKFDRTTALLEEWSHKGFCKRKELDSLIGHLQQACQVVPQGRSFLPCMTIFARTKGLLEINVFCERLKNCAICEVQTLEIKTLIAVITVKRNTNYFKGQAFKDDFDTF